MSEQKLEATIVDIARRARHASHMLSALDTPTKDAWLARTAERLEAAKSALLETNERDKAAAAEKGLAQPLVNRLDLGLHIGQQPVEVAALDHHGGGQGDALTRLAAQLVEVVHRLHGVLNAPAHRLLDLTGARPGILQADLDLIRRDIRKGLALQAGQGE